MHLISLFSFIQLKQIAPKLSMWNKKVTHFKQSSHIVTHFKLLPNKLWVNCILPLKVLIDSHFTLLANNFFTLHPHLYKLLQSTPISDVRLQSGQKLPLRLPRVLYIRVQIEEKVYTSGCILKILLNIWGKMAPKL